MIPITRRWIPTCAPIMLSPFSRVCHTDAPAKVPNRSPVPPRGEIDVYKRQIMDRRNETVSTRFGDAQVKVCGYKGKQYFYPEYESVKTICREHGVDFRTAYDEIRRKAEEAR